jgi:signal transduction histidine kinase
MRSIRRSLVLWFLALAVVALAAVGGVIDSVVRTAVAGRESAAKNLIIRQHDQRRLDELDRVDQSLLDEARAIAQSVQVLYANNLRPLTDPLTFFPLTTFGFGVSNPLAAATALQLAVPGSPPGGVVSRDFLSQRTVDDKLLGKQFTDDDHFRDYYQVHTFGRNRLLSQSLAGKPLPDFNRNDLDRQLPNWLPGDDITLEDGTPARRVVYATPVLLRFFGPMRGGRGGGGPGGGNRDRQAGPPPPPRQQPLQDDRVAQYPRAYIQTARPMSVVNQKFAEFAAERNEQLARLRFESAAAVSRTRWLLLAVGAGGTALLLAGSALIISRGLRPVDRLSEAVSLVNERDFRLPVTADELSVELLPVHARLTASLDALRQAFEREKRAVADISHELRTPVAALAATIDVSLRKPRTPEQYKVTLEECRDINRQLGGLVERVMTLASLDAGGQSGRRGSIDVGELATGCVSLIRPLATAHDLTVTADVAPGLTITSDADQLREVLMNLLHNAVEYTPGGGKIELTARPDGSGGATFVVRDTGIGMTPDVTAKIFERFYRADASRTATGIHAGLGLSIVKEYLDRLGGRVTVESRPGAGSTFTVSVPTISA